MEKHEAWMLKELTQHPWWKILENELMLEVEEIENKLMSVRWEQWNKIQYNEDDMLRATRNVFLSVINTPSLVIESFE